MLNVLSIPNPLSSFFPDRAAREPEPQRDTREQNRRAQKLRRREDASVNVVGRIITAEKFHDAAADRIADEVEREDLSISKRGWRTETGGGRFHALSPLNFPSPI